MITIEEELKELMISLKENMYTYVMTQSQYDPSSIHSI